MRFEGLASKGRPNGLPLLAAIKLLSEKSLSAKMRRHRKSHF
jgi:hypothetical protein